MSFISVLETVGKDFAKGLQFALTYALPIERLVSLLFPSTGPTMAAVADATTLVQNAVLLVEQKYAASGVQSGTGEQKLAEVQLLAGNAVSSLLGKAGIPASSDYISKLISAVVAILNVQPAATTTK